ncbi:MAG TPA: type II toxin-antitoxin system VapC family toxin [Polyangiaceae bacterium]
MKYILDTNAVSAVMKGEPSLLRRMQVAGKKNLGIPEPVYAELAYGIERLPKSKRRSQLQSRYDAIYSELGSIAWDHAVTEHYGLIKAQLERKGKRIEDFDAAIAAHALANGAVLVTANVEHMARVPGLVVEDWLEPLE